MKKSLMMTLALVLGLTGTSFAANPFSDVPTKHWAYDAVAKLHKAGVVDGYADGAFKGEKTISRYEMATIVAKAMAKSEKADAANKALVDKLAVEFKSELDTLGVRVSSLENQLDNVKYSGFFRARYDHEKNGDLANTNGSHYLLTVDATAKVNDQWTAHFGNEVRYSYNNYNTNGYGGNSGSLFRAWAEGQVGKTNIAIGRKWFGYGDCGIIGQEGNGIWADFNTTGLKTSVFAAKMVNWGKTSNTNLYGINFNSDLSKTVNGNLLIGGNKKDEANAPYSNWGQVTVAAKMGPDFKMTASYGKTNADTENKRTHFRIDYKGADLSAPGSYGMYARYFNAKVNSAPAGDDEWGSIPTNGKKGWIVGVDYTLAKNVAWNTLYTDQKDIATDAKRQLVRSQVQFNF